MSEYTDLFTELLFGEGAWLGLIIILVLCFSVSYKLKGSGIIFSIILFFLGLEYLSRVPVNSNFMWSIIICWVSAIFIVYQSMHNIGE